MRHPHERTITLADMLLALVCVSCGGCASTASNHATISPTPYGATIQSYEYRKSAFNWGRYTVIAIDNQPVSKMCWDCTDRQYSVTPGSHTILVRANFNFQFSGPGPFEAYVAVPMEAEQGARYIVDGEVKNDKVKVWIRNMGTGAQAGEPAVEDFGSAPSHEFTPIIIPAG